MTIENSYLFTLIQLLCKMHLILLQKFCFVTRMFCLAHTEAILSAVWSDAQRPQNGRRKQEPPLLFSTINRAAREVCYVRASERERWWRRKRIEKERTEDLWYRFCQPDAKLAFLVYAWRLYGFCHTIQYIATMNFIFFFFSCFT